MLRRPRKLNLKISKFLRKILKRIRKVLKRIRKVFPIKLLLTLHSVFFF